MTDIKTLQQQISAEIDKLQFGTEPKELYEPISYIMSLGGKRMRPLLVLLGYLLKEENAAAVVRQALAVEVFHNFTLMHDDIMDEAPLRRGQPTVHEKWNSTVAILSGDTMLVKAYDLLLEINPKLLPEAIRLFNQTAVEVCEGQQIDMNFEAESQVSVDAYINMIRLKTAVLLGFSLEYGALMAGMAEPGRKQLYEVGVQMGVGFQLMDDLLDVYADQAKFGKQVGGDIISNKKTFLLIKALELATGKEKEALDSWLEKTDFDSTEKVEAVTAIYDQLGIRELTTNLMNSYFDKGFELLDRLDARPEGKELLAGFAAQLMKREK
ncbi:polyprenyl synthetase family protein [Marinoscillum furvescens]|uniref:Geranylgeranyl diphosphate synthase type II n=1 Tax=Marinoscillum furvescens DSM 4134 TaxID=1122208 RepID=A0A3D9L6T4_MARFU|nr:polyprenyl synthetase family protein [Marinoscillum furvescens]REE01591.1 geranylgeranyl diphosphate synthase type II [Marinoscillum furvescens DSM 4134]